MGALSPMHLILILGIALLILGPKRLPESGEALGRALREFREAMNGDDKSTAPATAPAPAAPAPVAPPVVSQAAATPTDEGAGPTASA